jgi:hypothetical protein
MLSSSSSTSGQAQELATMETHARITCMCVNDASQKASQLGEVQEAEEQTRTVRLLMHDSSYSAVLFSLFRDGSSDAQSSAPSLPNT